MRFSGLSCPIGLCVENSLDCSLGWEGPPTVGITFPQKRTATSICVPHSLSVDTCDHLPLTAATVTSLPGGLKPVTVS